MTTNQEHEVIEYLKAKGVPIDILLEVKDHFFSQIENLQFSKNLNFSQAFEEVKLSWEPELKSKSVFLTNRSFPKFVADIMIKKDKNLLKKAAILGVPLMLLLLIVFKMVSNQQVLKSFVIVYIVSFFLVPIIAALKYPNRKFFNTDKKSTQYSIYQRNSILFIFSFSMILQILINSSSIVGKLSALVQYNKSDANTWILIGVLFLNNIYLIFANLNFLEHIKVISKIKEKITSIG